MPFTFSKVPFTFSKVNAVIRAVRLSRQREVAAMRTAATSRWRDNLTARITAFTLENVKGTLENVKGIFAPAIRDTLVTIFYCGENTECDWDSCRGSPGASN